MASHSDKLIKVADDQIRHLALRSEELRQETRVSVYLFSDSVQCLIFDMDVMRLPSISDLYRAYGMTALIDATLKSQEDLSTTSQIYGDHAFLTFVLTDGAENSSLRSFRELTSLLLKAGENWTIGFLVPDAQGETYMTRIGVPKGNIARWDTASVDGLHSVASTIRTATDDFMTNRGKGIRGTRDVFSTGVEAVNSTTVRGALTPMTPGSFGLLPVRTNTKVRIDDFVSKATGKPYSAGGSYYQLTKTEKIQAQKQIIVYEKSTGKAYAGAEARHLVGLPDGKEARVRPDQNPLYDIFVQSTSFNRLLVPGTSLLLTR